MFLRSKAASLLCLPLLAACSMTATPNLHIINGETRMNLTQSAPIARGADISPDGRHLLTGGMDGFTYWDISKGTMIERYSAQLPQIMGTLLTTGLVPVAFVSNGRYALSGGEELMLWDLASGRPIRKIGDDPAESIGVSADGRSVLTCVASEWAFKQDKMIVHDVGSGRKISEWEVGMSGGIIALSPDGRYAMSSGGGGRKSVSEDRGAIRVWEVAGGRSVAILAGTGRNKGVGQAVLAMAFSQDGRYALSGGTDGSLRLWEIPSGAELKSIQAHSGWVGTKAVAFSPDGKYLLSVGGSDGLARLWDRSSGSLVREFQVSDDRFTALRRFGGLINGWVSFTPDSGRIIFMGSDASFRIFDVATGAEVATLVLFDDGEWLVVTPEGYYSTSPKGAQHLKVNYGGRDFGVEQFYDVFYRPDIVAAKLAGQEIGGLVSITMKEASRNPPPTVDFTATPSDTDQPKAKVCYRAANAGGGIGEIRIFHNGKLIQSDGYYRDAARNATAGTRLASLNSRAIYEEMRGITVRGTVDAVPQTGPSRGERFEECREVETMPGENEISITAFNGNNTVQSPVKTVRFKSGRKAGEPHLYILAVGIDQYKDRSVNLRYAVKDATDIEERLKIRAATLYQAGNIHYFLLTNQEATKKGIRSKIDELARIVKPGDAFIFFAAGHGVLQQNQYYMLTHDYEGTLDEPCRISSNEIVEISKKIKSLSQLFVFDTCHAGGVDHIIGGLYDARMSVLAKKMGLHIFASASDRQAAMDGYQGNGLFTHTLLEGLNNNREADMNKEGRVTIVGLGEYSKRMTTSLSKQLGHEQTPIIINFGKDSPIYKLP